MTKRERLLTAISGGVPDQVPVSPHIHWRFAEKLVGGYQWQDILEAHKIAGTIAAFKGPFAIGPNSDYDARWGMESKLISEKGTEKAYERTIRNKKGEVNWLCTIGFDASDPTLGFTKKYFVTESAHWDVIEQYWLDELENAGMPEHEQIDKVHDALGDDGIAGVTMNGTYGRLSLVRGMEGLLLDIFDMPDRIHALMDLAYQYRKKEIQSFIESKADTYLYDICWATGTGMSPEMFKEWVFPDICKICDMVRDVPGKYIGFYTLGRVKNYVDMMVDAGPDFFASFEQNEGDITMAEVKKRVGTKICICGNFDPLILQDGTVQQAREEAKRCLDEAMEGGAFVLSTGDEVPPTTKLDNLKAMAEVAAEYGCY